MKKWGIVVMVVGVMLLGASCNQQANTEVVSNTTPATNQTSTPSTNTVAEKPVAKTVTINYTGNSFSPSSITINVGDTVKFINTGQTAAMWPAANPHPIHTSVPGFDAKRPVDTGGTYAFTFTKAGTVNYHNHLNASQVGTIIVK